MYAQIHMFLNWSNKLKSHFIFGTTQKNAISLKYSCSTCPNSYDGSPSKKAAPRSQNTVSGAHPTLRSSSERVLSSHYSPERCAIVSLHGSLGLHVTAHYSSLLEHSVSIHLPNIRERMSQSSPVRVTGRLTKEYFFTVFLIDCHHIFKKR